MITVILYQPHCPGNIGAIARVLNNFGHSNLVLVRPRCNHLDKEAMDRSTQGKQVLVDARVVETVDLSEFDYVVGTTARPGEDNNIIRTPIGPRDLAKRLPSDADIAILFGQEDCGLSNEMLNRCHLTTIIPTQKECPTLNLSHAVAVLLYEFFLAHADRKTPGPEPALRKELDILESLIDEKLQQMEFPTENMRETQKVTWRRVVAKSFLTKCEAKNLIGMFKNLLGRR